ncbi:sulfite exporter TauE/SafE family protein [Exilibacterium tricleocarpae]|uniref:Probable membrane transporter protein n=1 Tax=Exilibacterium tricleocarpae TaxID=2591008 RepID=A0A545U9L4_9GAMM|nr:sulfite exporter TauE/SafE family protein [Exilibacterium tricleocarpae]TQV86164.1 sulfite exporter TauE/SafE family protein [Exilibacterium tricleocarpae]
MKRLSLTTKLYFPAAVVAGMIAWSVYVFHKADLSIFESHWISALVMVFGSFIAGSTPLGGGAAAFPVFTKLLLVDASQTKIFSLFIQSVGMTYATLFFYSAGLKIHWRVILYLMPSTICSMALGISLISFADPTIKLVFSLFALASGILLIHRNINNKAGGDFGEAPTPVTTLVIVGFLSGLLASIIGSGADTLLFFIFTLFFNRDAKRFIPTSVAYMAISSIVGSICILLLTPTAISDFVSHSWIVSVPIVMIGAPLGGYIMSRTSPQYLFILIKVLLITEGVSTFMLARLSAAQQVVILFFIALAAYYLFCQCRHVLRLKVNKEARPDP